MLIDNRETTEWKIMTINRFIGVRFQEDDLITLGVSIELEPAGIIFQTNLFILNVYLQTIL